MREEALTLPELLEFIRHVDEVYGGDVMLCVDCGKTLKPHPTIENAVLPHECERR